MNKNTISTLFQISLLFLMVMAPLAAAQDSPDYPMILHGTVVDIDSGENAPEGTIVKAKDSETGKEIGMITVSDNGIFGDAINNKLLINKCESFDLIVVLEGNEVKVETITWKEGSVAESKDVWYSKDTTTVDRSGNGGSSGYRAGVSDDQSTETAVAGGAGSDTGSESPTTDTTTLSEAESSRSTNEGKSSWPLIIALLAIIAIIAYLAYQKLY